MEEINSGTVTIDRYVFDPKQLTALVSPAQTLGHDFSLSAESREEVVELLKASFGDWLDFIFIPQPKPFVIYADHDEYATFYAASKSNLNRATEKLVQAGFKQVEGFQRDV